MRLLVDESLNAGHAFNEFLQAQRVRESQVAGLPKGFARHDRDLSFVENDLCQFGRGVYALTSNFLADSSRHVNIGVERADRKSTRLNSSHVSISYAVFCLKKKNVNTNDRASVNIHT